MIFNCFSLSLVFTQNVGIGTSTPLQKLHVAGHLRFDGALMPAGNAGIIGDALTSQGPGLAPVWQSPALGQQFATTYSSSAVSINYGATYTSIPGLAQTITVPAIGTYDVYFFTDGGASFDDLINANKGVQLEISIWVDGAATRYITQILDNTSNLGGGIRNFATSFYATLSAGSHTVDIKVRHRTSTVANTITVGAPNVVGNYLICSLTVGLIKR